MKNKKNLNKNLNKAAAKKNDEFYTQIQDIELEIKHYRKHFKNKTVFCNCDDPSWSNFWSFFAANFEFLGLKKLISTHYKKEGSSYKLILHKDINKDGKINLLDTQKISLKENGDFRSQECIDILKESDIIVTNPPFSLFREYIEQLVNHKKKFLIIGSQNAITYKEFFPLLKNNKVWLGNTSPKKFKQPDGTFKNFGNISWFTNLEHSKRNEEIILYKTYLNNKQDYPKYDNYNAIEVSKVKDIPLDFKGIMGVPISFLNKYNPEQFEILGITDRQNSSGLRTKKYTIEDDLKFNDLNARSVIKSKNIYDAKYARILIKNKNV